MKDTIKKHATFGYIAFTLIGAYSAAMFYAGMQFAPHPDTQVVRVPVVQAAGSPKALGR